MIEIHEEAGFIPALYGLGLSYGLTSDIPYKDFLLNKPMIDKLKSVSYNLYYKNGGHNKFLEHIEIWMLVDAPRFFWSQADTYRLSTKQSASTMHTLKKHILTQDMFYEPIEENYLNFLNLKLKYDTITIDELKSDLPEGFMQKREWKISYNVLRNIILQRKNHELRCWKIFCREALEKIEWKEYFEDLKIGE